MTWFSRLMGFPETDPATVRRKLELDDDWLRSRVSGQRYACGRLELPSLAELRARAHPSNPGAVSLREVVADVQALHRDPDHSGALFQAASQFNLLEMASPDVTPEAGVGLYENDRTQGPACATACGAGTIYRNYLVPVGPHVGQSADHQLDCLAELGEALGNDQSPLWQMQNGYALLTQTGLQRLGPRLNALSEEDLDTLRGKLRVGVQWNTGVTLDGAEHRVTQVYGSALPVAYGQGRTEQWAALARLILEASYEATLRIAVENAANTGCSRVFLTLLGGGVFGNRDDWISAAIVRALGVVQPSTLDIALVSYGQSKPMVQDLISEWMTQ